MKETRQPTPAKITAPLFGKPGGTPPFFQTKRTVNPPHDAFEAEADRVADAAVRLSARPGFVQPKLRVGPAVQRKCAHCEQDEKAVQRKGHGDAPAATPEVETTLSQPGQALDADTRAWAESSLGHDFSAVKIHTDDAAAQSAASIRARAYTSGTDVVFGSGEFSPTTESGRHLLAHELTHVVQQNGTGGTIQRVPTAAELATFDADAKTIRAHAAYKVLKAGPKVQVEEILKIARTRDNASYYSQKMLDLLNTPDAPAQAPAPGGGPAPAAGAVPSTEETNRADTERSMYDERSRKFYTPGSVAEDVEELASADPARKWKKRKGMDGVTFEVDANDPANIVVRAKVHLKLKSRTKGAKQTKEAFEALKEQDKKDLAMVKELEDGIEKTSAALGYTVDLQFVDKGGPGVFTADVDMTRWTDAGNFVGTAADLAHELHHLLGLDDRYNYIEAHATNADMKMANRIYWFREEMKRVYTPGADSLMDSARTGRMLPDDIAGVTGLKATDVEAAQKKIKDQIAQVSQQAQQRVNSAILQLNGTHPTLGQQQRLWALETARRVLSPTLTEAHLDGIADYLDRMRGKLSSGKIDLGPEIAQCSAWSGYVLDQRLPIHLCRRWLTSTPEEQIRTLIHESAHASGIGEPKGETYEMYLDCTARNQNLLDVADAWGHFVHCLSGQTPDTVPPAVP